MRTIYESLAMVAGMSPRQVRNYHEQHLERCWCGNWINNFLNTFVLEKEDSNTRYSALVSLMNHHKYMVSSDDKKFFTMIRMRARKKLGLQRRPLVTRTRG